MRQPIKVFLDRSLDWPTIGIARADVNASFFAQAYTLGGKTIISYRGTDT